MVVSAEAAEAAEPSPGDVFQCDCPGRYILDHVTSRWGMLIIAALCNGKRMRFYELRDRIGGVSEKMLAQTLRTLARDGLLTRIVEPTRPPKVSYELTPLGRGLATNLRRLVNWIGENTGEIMAAQDAYDKAG